MKKILLIGDSIRKGYDLFVKEQMCEVAEVLFPPDNCQTTATILRYFHIWCEGLSTFDFDAVHWNAGAWDTLRIYGDDCLIPPEVYKENLVRIVKRIRRVCPKAVQIFATTTPVLESGYIPEYEMRYNRDILRYNEIAVQVMAQQGVLVNDLYALMRDTPDAYHSDQTHYYTAEATKLLGDAVSGALCDALSLSREELTTPEPSRFAITTYRNDNECYIRRGDIFEPVLGQ